MRFSPTTIVAVALLAVSLPACHQAEGEHHEEHQKIVATSPIKQDVTVTEQYVCQIHSRRHIEVRALERGYLENIPVKEGQRVTKGDLLFKILATLYQAKADAEKAEAQLAQIEFDNTKRLYEEKVVSEREVALARAKLAKAQANVDLAQAELDFTDIKAPFDGIIDRLHEQQGSLVEEGDILTTMSDNGVMWVYFNVPEARYLEYQAEISRHGQDNKKDDDKDDDDDDDDDDKDQKGDSKQASNSPPDMNIELVLANGNKFPRPGVIGAIEADFNNETGNIAFRADFDNSDGLLRHGQTGSILIHRKVHDALVIPQRATFETLDKRYAFVIDKDGVVRQRDIEIDNELDDIYLIRKGLQIGDKIVLEGIAQVRDGEKVEYEFESPEEVLAHLKYRAE